MRLLRDLLAHWRGRLPWPERYVPPRHGWTCFHRGETFYTAEGARLHFGPTPEGVPYCIGRNE